MKLIANRPCSFGGRQFYIGDEISADLVADAKAQQKMGVLTIVENEKQVSGEESGAFFTQEELEKMVAEAVDEAVNNTVQEMEQKQQEMQEAVGVLQGEDSLFNGTVIIPVRGDSAGDSESQTTVLATVEEIQQVFSIMQMNAADGAGAIAEVKSENVLILLHAADTRKTIKDAAKKQADNIFSISDNPNESTSGNEAIGTNTEGVDA